jgi:6-phosphogluconolactonase
MIRPTTDSTLAPELLTFPDREALSRAAAQQFVEIARGAIASRGRFAVALSGGSTPRDLYEQLKSDEVRAQVDWEHCHFFWGDERAVPPDHPDSNFRMANETLLACVSVPPAHIHRIRAEKNPQVAADEYEHTLRRFFGGRLPRFDLILLGLGTNGHTASLFPHTSVLYEKTRWCAAVWVPELNANRITLTVSVLNNAAHVIFLVAGRDKAVTLRAVLRGTYQPDELPAQLIHPHDGKLLWLLDEAAASDLKQVQT